MDLKLTCLCGTPGTFWHVWHARVQRPSASEGLLHALRDGDIHVCLKQTKPLPQAVHILIHNTPNHHKLKLHKQSPTSGIQNYRFTMQKSEESKQRKREEKGILVNTHPSKAEKHSTDLPKICPGWMLTHIYELTIEVKCSEKRDCSFQRDESWHWPPKCFIRKACELVWQIPPDAKVPFYFLSLSTLLNQILLVSLLFWLNAEGGLPVDWGQKNRV